MLGLWPGPTPTTASFTWYERFGGQPRASFTGAWAWFRLIDVAQQERENNDLRTSLTFTMPGHRARVVLEAASIFNPFTNRDWQRFSCQF
jgi:type VI secretion system protein ImpL